MELGEMIRRLDGMVGRAIQALGAEPAPRGSESSAQAAAGPSAAEHELLGTVELFLSRGLDLKRWWDGAYARKSLGHRFALGRTFDEPDTSFGFFDQAPVAGASMPVMGNYQEMFYDHSKSPRSDRVNTALWMRDQIREFVLRYFMRVSAFRMPDAYVANGGVAPPAFLRPLSHCPVDEPARSGFGFEQLFYKLKGSGEIGAFPPEQRFAIVDLRDLGRLYEWIVLRVQIFDFNFNLKPLGSSGPQVSVPLDEASYLVLAPEFILQQEDSAPGILGRYGFGYSFIKNPSSGFLTYGPGEFEAALELIQWTVLNSGEARVEMAFVANRPQRISNLALDPVELGFRVATWGTLGLAAPLLAPLRRAVDGRFQLHLDPIFGLVDLANVLTLGLAGRELCWSREQLEKDFLAKHFLQHYQAIAGSLPSWRLVCDWLDAAEVPSRIAEGRSR